MSATAITIGNFDGIHLGHQSLVRRCRELAGPRGKVVAVTFDPPPSTIIDPTRPHNRLTTPTRRTELLREAGCDEVFVIRPTPEFLLKTPDEFADWIVQSLHPTWIVEGTDFCFGRGRAGTIETLRTLGTSRGFSVDTEFSAGVALSDHLVVKASSSIVRWLLDAGRVFDASLVLGRSYRVSGLVTQGDRRGRTISFPTANVSPTSMLPGDGVYAGLATLPNGDRFTCAANVGTRPTFNGTERRLEVHLLAAPRDGERLAGLDEYGWELHIDFIAWLRDQVKFSSIDSLIKQLHRDIARARLCVAHPSPPPPELVFPKHTLCPSEPS